MTRSWIDAGVDALLVIAYVLLIVCSAFGWMLVAYTAAGTVGAVVMAVALAFVGRFVWRLGR